MTYLGYTIEKDLNSGFAFFKTEHGRQDDYDCDDGDLKYCGNAGFAQTIDDALEMINEKFYWVQMNGRDYPWKDFTDAIKFAIMWDGKPLFEIQSM